MSAQIETRTSDSLRPAARLSLVKPSGRGIAAERKI
jgi:hypothetical protein